MRQTADRCVGSIDYEEVLADIIRRDRADTTRETSPLKKADDAVEIDSTGDHIETVIAKICELANERRR